VITEKAEMTKPQALDLAKEHKRAEPNIKQVYWFPDPQGEEVRLVELEDNVPSSASGCVEPFYFDPSIPDNLPAATAVAVIRTDEFRRLDLPEDWGTWEDAEQVFP